jgi:CheY-like chemotaxis protein
MPVMDGFQATKRIRRGEAGIRSQSIKIVALTANPMKQDKEDCLTAGMDDFLAKPNEPNELLMKLQKYLC